MKQRPHSTSSFFILRFLRRDWFCGLILILSVILAYTPIWKAGFVWDDEGILTANPCIVGPLGLKEIWTTSAADICPLTITTFWSEHALWGLAPLPYHLVNALLHGVCAIVLWRVLRNLRVQGAWLGAALWALHPVQVESVAWITELKNTESGLFFLLSILCFVRWLRANEPNEERTDDGVTPDVGRGASPPSRHSGATAEIRPYQAYILSLLFAALAMASKSSTVILPMILLLCAWWLDGRWEWRIVGRVVPMFLMAVAASALSIWTQALHPATVIEAQWTRTWPQRLSAAGDAIWFYLGKLLWPHPLMTVYPRWQIDAGQWVSYLGLVAVIIVLSIFWINRERWARPWFFAFAYFVVALLPILGLIDNPIFTYSLVFDHLQYLGSIGPLALVGAGFTWTWKEGIGVSDFAKDFGELSRAASSDRSAYGRIGVGPGISQDKLPTQADPTLKGWRVSNKESLRDLRGLLCKFFLVPLAQIANQLQVLASKNPWFRPAFCAGLLVILGMITWQRTWAFESAENLWTDTLAKNPTRWVGYDNLGLWLFRNGKIREAIAQYQKSLEINPDNADVRDNLADALVEEGQLDTAVSQFQTALESNPDNGVARSNLGAALFRRGEVPEAIAQYRRALQIMPYFAEARYNLGAALFLQGQVDEAIAQYQKALEIKPNYADAYYGLGAAFFRKGRWTRLFPNSKMRCGLSPATPKPISTLVSLSFKWDKRLRLPASCKRPLKSSLTTLKRTITLASPSTRREA
jgi:protein O-mannosyl-transferase